MFWRAQAKSKCNILIFQITQYSCGDEKAGEIFYIYIETWKWPSFLNSAKLLAVTETRCYETILSSWVTFTTHCCTRDHALYLPHNYYVLPSAVVHWHWKREYPFSNPQSEKLAVVRKQSDAVVSWLPIAVKSGSRSSIRLLFLNLDPLYFVLVLSDLKFWFLM